jgi:nicotinate-nucleotide adenylyltransferase
VTSSPLGVFGGTFNPIHNGHLRSALEIRDLLGLEQVLLIPAAEPPLRERPGCDATFRAELVELAISGEAGLVCDRRELSRPGPSYTVDTLTELRDELGSERSLCLIVGADALERLDHWHRWAELLDLAHVAVMARPGWTPPNHGVVADWLHRNQSDNPASLREQASGSIVCVTPRQLPISSSEIRELIAAGRSPRYLLPDAVWSRIRETGAYGNQRHLQERHGSG